MNKSITIGTVLIIGLLAGITAAATADLTTTTPVNASGLVAGINVTVFADSSLTQNLTTVNWGSIEPGRTGVFTLWIKNTGTISETLNATTALWVPAQAKNLLTFTWDREGYSLGPGQSTQATLNLAVPSSVTNQQLTTFSFLITFFGVGAGSNNPS